MSKRWRLNKRGKMAATILLTSVILVFFGLLGGKKDAATEGETTSPETLSVAVEPGGSFDDSHLKYSMIEQAMQEKEEARQQAVAKQNKAEQKENALYLTFDDGPSDVADELLEILDEYDIKATFFMLGPNIKENPDVVNRMEENGHGLALHGITHEADSIYSSPDEPVEEMLDDQDILENVTGYQSSMARMPYGSIPYLTQEMRYLLDKHDFDVWDWNVDSRDWELEDGDYVEHTIEEIEEKKQAGETPIVLLHDKEETVEHLPKLLDYIKKQDYKTKVLDGDMAPVTFPCEGRCHPVD